MAEYTKNYNLKKPDEEEFYNVSDFNGNMDIMDTKIKALNDSIESGSDDEALQEVKQDIQNVDGKIGSSVDGTGTASLFGKLSSILSSLTTHVGNWTSTRAGKIDKLDNLDTTVSSRAAAGTALSNATWTNARAGKIDSLDTTVSSRAAAGTALSNATWTNARAGYLDYLANGTYGLNAIKSACQQYFVSETGVGTTLLSNSNKYNINKSNYTLLAKFVAPVSGLYKITLTGVTNSGYSEDREMSICAISNESTTVGGVLEGTIGESYPSYNITLGSFKSSYSGVTKNYSIYIPQGTAFGLLAKGSDSFSNAQSTTNLLITYEKKGV